MNPTKAQIERVRKELVNHNLTDDDQTTNKSTNTLTIFYPAKSKRVSR
ncbi:conserved hypothetical protein [Vibrio parahaemolyticus AN-5034]|nr:conserved hypothetical protein [Vibrio parahaemolyticus AN-5034]